MNVEYQVYNRDTNLSQTRSFPTKRAAEDAAKLLNYQTVGGSKGPHVAWTENEILNFLQAKREQAHRIGDNVS